MDVYNHWAPCWEISCDLFVSAAEMDPASAWLCRIYQNLKGSAEAEWLLSIFSRQPLRDLLFLRCCLLFVDCLLCCCFFCFSLFFFLLILSKHLLLLPTVFQPAFWVLSALHRYYCVYSPLSLKAGKSLSFFRVIYLTPFFLFSSYEQTLSTKPGCGSVNTFVELFKVCQFAFSCVGFSIIQVADAD